MRIGLASYRCENKNIEFNMSQIELALKQSKDKVDLLCFGEAFLQGFDSLCWDYDIDKSIAIELSSDIITKLKNWSIEYNTSLLVGYIEKSLEKIYSSCVVISDGSIIHNYRRISKGWKEFSKTDNHYCEGNDTESFKLFEKNINIALCGDLWDFPNTFKTNNLLIWPVYVNYTTTEWESDALEDYARQASLVAKDVLMINPLDANPINHGGSFYFQNGNVVASIHFDAEDILIVDIS